MTAEYRQRYRPNRSYAIFRKPLGYICAGGSMPNLPRTTDPRLPPRFLACTLARSCMNTNGFCANQGRQYLIYCAGGSPNGLGVSGEKSFLIIAKR